MSCKDWETLGLGESYEECCEDYPDYCQETRPALKCSSINEYKSFDFKNCSPEGWKQVNDDCWLDSTLYVLFAPTQLAPNMAVILDQLNASEDKDEKNIALHISNYLDGLNDNSWSDREECKQLHKNEIGNSLLSWNETHQFKLFDEATAGFQFFRNPNDDPSGNIGRGPQDVLITFFSLVSNDIEIKKIESNDVRSYCSTTEQKPIKRLIDSLTSDKKILIISMMSIDIASCQDSTTLPDVQQFNNYNLQSIIHGSGAHITSATSCNETYFKYDNMEKPVTLSSLNPEDPYFKYAQTLFMVYMKTTAGGYKKKRKTARKGYRRMKNTLAGVKRNRKTRNRKRKTRRRRFF